MDSARSGAEELSKWHRWRRFDRLLVRYAVLAIVVPALTLGAFAATEQLNAQYRAYEQIRFSASLLLEAQVDEESGIRGFEATSDALFLQQYYRHAGLISTSIASLSALLNEPLAAQALSDFSQQHADWNRLVAAPAITHAGRGDVAREQTGRVLTDRMKRDIGVLDSIYDRLGRATLERARLVTIICALGIVTVVALMALLGFFSERAYARREERLLTAVIDKRDVATRIGEWRAKVVAMLAHDFKSTLAVIKGYSHLLQDFPERREDPAAYRGIDQAVTELAYMADDALLMARMSGGSFEVAHQPLQLSSLLKEITERYRERRTVTLESDDDARVSGDHFYLLRLFDNLVSNAVKYSPTGTPVTVRLTHNGTNDVQISVTDRGKGIAQSELPHVFEEYWRSPDAATKSGTGIGLFIVKKIVDSHGGNIAVESVLGYGTTVRVTLPALQPAPQSN